MFELLKKYEGDSFYFSPNDDLKAECKAAGIHDNCCGVYIVYAYGGENKEVVYIGSSGHMDKANIPVPRIGGLRRRIYGKQKSPSGELKPRKELWSDLMIEQGIGKLEIFWYNTGNPLIVEFSLILEYIIRHKRFPRWNNELKLEMKFKNDLEKFVEENNVTDLKI